MTIDTKTLRSEAQDYFNAGLYRAGGTLVRAADTIDSLTRRLEITDDAPGWDGIACRDETIRSQEKVIDAQAAEIAEAKGQIEHLDRQNNALRQSLGSMIHAYVRLLECGRDRILDLGGQCDSLDVLEANDPWLRDARAALSGESKC